MLLQGSLKMKPTATTYSRKIENPSFFKVLIKDDFLNRVRIPRAFVRKYDGYVHKRFVTLVSMYGSWTVLTDKMDGDICFHKGWEKFVKDNMIKRGDILVFKKIRTSTFEVKHFDPTCCEKEVKIVEKSIVKNKKSLICFESIYSCHTKKNSLVATDRSGEICILDLQGEADQFNSKRRLLVNNQMEPKSTMKTEKPLFCKLLVMDDAPIRARIPPAFVRKLNGFMDKRFVTLVSRYGSWKVRPEKMEGEFYFHKGWDNFAKYHLLGYGDFLLFKKVQVSTFKVKIYDPSCCEKEMKHAEESVIEDEDVDEDVRGESYLATNLDAKKFTGENITEGEKEVICVEDVSEGVNGESSLAASHANREVEKFNSKHPFFRVVMTYTYAEATRKHLSIPTVFFRTYMKNKGPNIKLVTSCGNVWIVSVLKWYKGHYMHGRIAKGWEEFVEANNLKAGDVCVFEMVEGDHVVFKVHTFKC